MENKKVNLGKPEVRSVRVDTRLTPQQEATLRRVARNDLYLAFTTGLRSALENLEAWKAFEFEQPERYDISPTVSWVFLTPTDKKAFQSLPSPVEERSNYKKMRRVVSFGLQQLDSTRKLATLTD